MVGGIPILRNVCTVRDNRACKMSIYKLEVDISMKKWVSLIASMT
jgi:hypothetical protein